VFEINMDESFAHLRSAPIVEAVIHWRAKAETSFDRDELKRQLADQLPDYPSVHDQYDYELQIGPEIGPQGSTTEPPKSQWQGFRIQSDDGKNITQFTRDGVVFSRLQPYQNWETFKAEAMRVWNIFVNMASPSTIQRLGVRFINRIENIQPDYLNEILKNPPQSPPDIDRKSVV